MIADTYPDHEVVLMDLLEQKFPEIAGKTSDRTPARLGEAGLFVRVNALGGNLDGFTLDMRLDVHVFGPTRPETLRLAALIMVFLVEGHHAIGGDVIDRADIETPPRAIPNEVDGVWEFGATYDVRMRQRSGG